MAYLVSCEKPLVSLPQFAVQVVIKGLMHTVPTHTRESKQDLSQSYREMPGTTVCDGMRYLLQVCIAVRVLTLRGVFWDATGVCVCVCACGKLPLYN